MVWLDIKNFFTKHLCRKLENCRASPYIVKRVINAQVFKLDLLENIRVHPVFYVNLLKPAAVNLYSGHIQPPPLPIEVDRETEWEFETIVDFCYFGCSKKLQYLVK